MTATATREPGAILRANLFGTRDIVADAVERIREYAPLAGPEGLWVAYSGGKDSVVILELCRIAGVRFEAHHSLTTIDPPELVYFVRATPDVVIDRPERNFFQRFEARGAPPLQIRRWCCEELKEVGGEGRIVVTGVRWAESTRRAKRRIFETCYRGRGRRLFHPILDWTDAEVWQFIRSRNLAYCSLYDRGRKRVGCLFCPYAPTRLRKLDCVEYPRYARLFRRSFNRIYEQRHATHPAIGRRWPNGDAWFDWWIEGKGMVEESGGLFE